MTRRSLLTFPLAALLSQARGTTREAPLSDRALHDAATLLGTRAAERLDHLMCIGLCHPYVSWELCDDNTREVA